MKKTDTTTIDIGTITVRNKILVTDPCYIPDSYGGAGTLELKTLPGQWHASIEIADERDWGMRVASLSVHRQNAGSNYNDRQEGEAYVDSGQMLIGCASILRKWEDNDFHAYTVDKAAGIRDLDLSKRDANPYTYNNACLATCGDTDAKGGLLGELAVVSSTGYGDGSYPIIVYRDENDDVNQIEVLFIEEDEEGW